MHGANLGFPPANAALFQTVERPVVLAGRMANPSRADEVVVSPHFMTAYHKRVGDTLTLHLSSPAQAAAGFDASRRTPAGPRVTVRIVGVTRTPFGLDSPGRQRRADPDLRPAHSVPRRHHGRARATARPTSTA